MKLVLVGLSHKNAPIEVREVLDKKIRALVEVNDQVKKHCAIKQVAILSTCNRVEFYAVTPEPEAAIHQIKNFLQLCVEKEVRDLGQYLYEKREQEVVHHLFRVACSLDSMVIGEPQILGQVKEAYRDAVEAKSTGPLINKIFHKAFSVAKRIRTETGIASHSVSVSSVAAELARQIFGDLSARVALIIGAGQMAELAAHHLIDSGIKELIFANRSEDKAEALAKNFDGEFVPYEKYVSELEKVDIVISSVAVDSYILSSEQISKIMDAREQRTIFLIDISVPRSLDPTINEVENAFLYDIDDLQHVVNKNIEERIKQARVAEKMVEEEVLNFNKTLEALGLAPLISSLNNKFTQIRDREVKKSLSRIKDLTPEQKQQVEGLADAITKKILHDPIAYLKDVSLTEDDLLLRELLSKLFDLKIDEKK